MPARPARLKRRSDFLRVAAARCKAVTPGLVLQARRRDAGDDCGAGSRVGYTASRKVGNAVARNRARRRLRALVDEIMVDRADPCTDYVLIARRAMLARPYGALRQDLESALSRVGRSTDRKA
jgi:ribonuclease P protein component